MSAKIKVISARCTVKSARVEDAEKKGIKCWSIIRSTDTMRWIREAVAVEFQLFRCIHSSREFSRFFMILTISSSDMDILFLSLLFFSFKNIRPFLIRWMRANRNCVIENAWNSVTISLVTSHFFLFFFSFSQFVEQLSNDLSTRIDSWQYPDLFPTRRCLDSKFFQSDSFIVLYAFTNADDFSETRDKRDMNLIILEIKVALWKYFLVI